ncbi:hypothetical protein KM1_188030 [Entamoeba histolytica HM-3:IMSS]|uniref:Uncharacterized protein n=3 Tax=Entamoeba TaxID=5758 RepID=K2HH17_ENTNP|nr:hypothetical protein ENU1_029230 [Entamoeba nuttalli P19]EKE42194.1 hypothetical protein ENU1_029230 [Entamoeba nuttalli P19]EMS12198.1 hypothetical protein KM1_188030 [Entamoeba histolytica HM-3:IMSS]|eukprot:XP_008855467.1 hypothetical protein ENU1_029230 [Entamoeba nuttalli P19]
MAKRKAANSKRVQKNKKARKELTEGLRRHRLDEILKNLKESTGVDVDEIVRRNRTNPVKTEEEHK